MSKHIVIIGAGPGGYPAAFRAAHQGMDVTLIDQSEIFGGVCLNVGCIPSKALLHLSRVINEARETDSMGVSFGPPDINLEKLRNWKNNIIKNLTSGIGTMSKKHKVRFIGGKASFISDTELEVKTADSTEKISFDACIIATGSIPARPGVFGTEDPRIIDSSQALELSDIPERFLVVGGGYIGLELGMVYDALGSKVTVVEMASGVLPLADRDLAKVVHKELNNRFSAILTDTRVTDIIPQDDGIKVKFVGLDIPENEMVFDKVLVSVGRRPNTQGLGLENTSVTLTEKGFIQVNPQRKTDAATIYAIGDVCGEPGLAHKATHEASVAVDAINDRPSEFSPACIPAVVFTDPEMAWCGITETEALNNNIPHKVSSFPWLASGRAQTLGRAEGLTKMLFDPHTGRLLGCGLVGVGAGDLISEAALAVEMGATAEDIAMTIHPHPTMSETLMEAAELFLGHSAHYIQKKKKNS